MKKEDYLALRSNILKDAQAVTEQKGPVYTRESGDVLRNFKASAEAAGITPGQALVVFMKKHVDALFHALAAPGGAQDSEPIEGRAVDVINYAILAVAIIKESESLEIIDYSGDGRVEFVSADKSHDVIVIPPYRGGTVDG